MYKTSLWNGSVVLLATVVLYVRPPVEYSTLKYVSSGLRKTLCYMPQLETLNYLSNVDNFFIDYGTLIKILSIFVLQLKTNKMKALQVKEAIKKMKTYNVDKLNTLANKSGISLMTINFWWNAIKN